MSKTILITGSTDGIGKLAAIRLAKEGHTVLIHGRSQEKLNKTVNEIRALANNDKVSGCVADFSDLNAVKQMAESVSANMGSLDVLINNAGVFKSSISKNSGGLDIRFVVNYLAPYQLTNLLLPLLEKGSDPRVINLSSAAQAHVALAALSGKATLGMQEAYAQSKLALTMWSFDLASRQDNLSVIAVNPGSLLNTKMVQEAYGRHWSSADKGADILYELAISSEYQGISGKYFDNDLGDPKGDFSAAHADTYDSLKIKTLLDATEELLSGIE